MPGRFSSSESRWSSERERQEREQRQKEFDANRGTPSRRSSWRTGSGGGERPASGESERLPREREPAPVEPATADEARPASVGRKWRDAVTPPPPGDGSSLPNLPGDDDGDRGRGAPSKGLIIFGAILFVLMAGLAFMPFGPLGGGDDDDPEPTQDVAVVPTEPAQDPAARGDFASTPPAVNLDDAEFVVCVDPGHGGWDSGWERLDPDTYGPPLFNEAEITLAMGLMLRDELESRGIGVVLTRESGTASNIYSEDVNGDGRTLLDGEQHGDRDELQRRINICNDAGADVLISLHLNGFDDPSVRGYETLYTADREFGDLNLDLATAVYRAIGRAYNEVGFETTARGVKDDQRDLNAETHEFGAEQHLVLTGPAVNNPDYSIEPSQMPGTFVEPVFITNQEDAVFIANPENQRLLVEAYADGIEDFFEQHGGE